MCLRVGGLGLSFDFSIKEYGVVLFLFCSSVDWGFVGGRLDLVFLVYFFYYCFGVGFRRCLRRWSGFESV